MVLGQAQKDVVSWTAELVDKGSNEYEVVIEANIKTNWFLYSQYLGEGGPIPTTIQFDEAESYSLIGKTEELEENGVEKMDEMFGMKLKKYKNKATFVQKISSEEVLTMVKGNIEFMTCDDSRCLAPRVIEFSASKRQ
jgi:thiol:disulfide interchange protein DsbD